MAKYLITSSAEVMDVVEAKSIREAVEGMNVKGEGEFVVYTVTSQRTVRFETVEETRLIIGSETSASDEDGDTDEDENGDKDE